MEGTSLPIAAQWAPSLHRREEETSLLLWRSCREATEEVPSLTRARNLTRQYT
jgi:hypothetical protein